MHCRTAPKYTEAFKLKKHIEYLHVAFSGRLFLGSRNVLRFYLKKFFQPAAICGIDVY
jgi:hypothetical protein